MAGGRELAVGNAFYGIITPLYNRDYWFLLSTGLKDAFEGDGTSLMMLSDAYTSRDPAGQGYLDNSIEANLSINCLDQPWSIPAVQVPAQIGDFEAASSVFGRVFAWGLTGCRGFSARAARAPATRDRRRRRADRGDRHDPRPRDALAVGARRWPPSWTRACWSPATATATPGTTRQRVRGRGRRVLPGRRRRPEDGLTC